jgi:hypothetical protein
VISHRRLLVVGITRILKGLGLLVSRGCACIALISLHTSRVDIVVLLSVMLLGNLYERSPA